MGEKRSAYRILVGKLEGKRPLGGPKCGWENNIKTNLREIGFGGGGGGVFVWGWVGINGRLLEKW
jgi:hypothetical protein